jgi:NADH:ubiquinone oxidoreductase subunit 5 (subunit L)/multisubunit Na+/H+ antiporter MnhA subunit
MTGGTERRYGRSAREKQSMEITMLSLWALIHGMGFGALYLLACSGALLELYFFTNARQPSETEPSRERFLKVYLIAMVVLAWFAVLTGAYIIYPWYRAIPPTGSTDLSMFPQQLLMSSSTTIGWHSFGMEWKEYVAWFAPISITMVAFVFIRYGRDLRNHRQLRAAVLCFTLVSFLAAGVAGLFGALINKQAPVHGGHTIQLSHGGEK